METISPMDPGDWRHVYDVWTEKSDPPPVELLQRQLPDWADGYALVERLGTDPWCSLWLVDEDGHPLVQVEHAMARWDPSDAALECDPDAELEQLLDSAQAHYILSVRDNAPEAVHGVQLALALARAVLKQRRGAAHDVSALRLLLGDDIQRILEADDFAIEDHVTLHLVTDEHGELAWLHSHGMEKFGRSNLETFDLEVSAGRDAGKLMNELLLSTALGTRALVREDIEVAGGMITALPSEPLRGGVLGVPWEELDGHEGPHLCLVNQKDFGDISTLVQGYLHRAISGLEDWEEELEVTRRLLPLVQDHFTANGSSTDFEYYARIPLQVRQGEGTTEESVWVRITRWSGQGLRGTLASDSMLDAELQVGMEVTFDSADIEAILLSKEGTPMGGRNLEQYLQS